MPWMPSCVVGDPVVGWIDDRVFGDFGSLECDFDFGGRLLCLTVLGRGISCFFLRCRSRSAVKKNLWHLDESLS
jgi:hypothetical protein